MGTWIELRAPDGFTLPAYRADPAGTPRGAVVVVQEIFGVNDHIRKVADGFAADGFLALAPAAFHRVRQGVELGYTPEDMTAGRELKAAVEALPAPGVMQDLQVAVAEAARASGGRKVGIVGYCWGGLLSWRAACTLEGLACAAPYYGGGMTVGAELARLPRVPTLVHFGEQDHWIPMDTVKAFAAAHPGVDVQVYDANHGFNCDQRGSWNEAAARLARERTLALFQAHLG